MAIASLLVCLKLLLTDIIGQEVSRKALGSIALGRIVVSITTEDQHSAAQQRRRVEVPGGAALCQDPPARGRKRERKGGSRYLGRCPDAHQRSPVCAGSGD